MKSKHNKIYNKKRFNYVFVDSEFSKCVFVCSCHT